MRIATFALLLTLIAAPGALGAPDEVEALLARAQALHEQALAMQHGWTVTEPLIGEARAALAAGDTKSARELAERALLTASQSVQQGERERSAWEDRVVGR